MNVAGKSLQDIYDAGKRRLEELENGQVAQLDESTRAHLKERMESEPAALKQLEDRAAELESEIRAYLKQGLERIEKKAGVECQHNEKHIQRLVDGLEQLSRKFSEAIGQLRESAENQLKDVAADQECLFKSAAQAAHCQAEQKGAVAIAECRQEATEGHVNISNKLEDSWDGVMESEDEAISDLLSSFDSSRDQVIERFNDCRKRLEDLVADKLSKLELRSMQAHEAVKSTVDRLIENADRHAFDSDVKLKERFSSLLYEMSTSFDETAARAISELAGLHESTMADLNMRTEELSRAMDSLAEDVTRQSAARSNELQEKGSNLVKSYTDELAQRLEASKVFHKEIDAERLQLVSEIWRELSEVRARFEERLSKLAQGTLEKMRTICTEAETAMVNAQQNCAAESKQHASDKQDAIQESTREFVERIERTRDKALEAIAKAAGASNEELEASAEAVVVAANNQHIDVSPPDEEPEEDTIDTTVDALKKSGGSENRRRKKSGKNSDKRGEGKK